jgi:hypothetical protein
MPLDDKKDELPRVATALRKARGKPKADSADSTLSRLHRFIWSSYSTLYAVAVAGYNAQMKIYLLLCMCSSMCATLKMKDVPLTPK